jgi:hypothetical protein
LVRRRRAEDGALSPTVRFWRKAAGREQVRSWRQSGLAASALKSPFDHIGHQLQLTHLTSNKECMSRPVIASRLAGKIM